MPRTSKNKFEIINDEIHISKEGWPLIGLTTYREDYYEELTSKTWTLTKANSETDDKGYLSNKTLGLLHRYTICRIHSSHDEAWLLSVYGGCRTHRFYEYGKHHNHEYYDKKAGIWCITGCGYDK